MAGIDEQAAAWRRRLNERQMQAAKFGISSDPSITIEIEDLQRLLANVDEIKHQLGLINIHRRSLETLAGQKAMHGAGQVPVSIINQIDNTRQHIAQLKQSLRKFYKYEVDPGPLDEEPLAESLRELHPQTDPLRRVRDRLHTLETLVRLGQKDAALELIEELRRIVG